MSKPNQVSSTVEIPDLGALPAIPRDHEGAVFAAPWEAKAFAMVVMLHQKGCFSWEEWTGALSARIAAAADAAPTTDEPPYYELWLAAAEGLLADKGLCLADELAARKEAVAAEHKHP